MRSTGSLDLLSNEDLSDNIDIILDALGLDYNKNDYTINLPCPIHMGTKPTGVTIYLESGYVSCWTNPSCSHFGHSIFGFIRGILSAQAGWSSPGDKMVSVGDTRKFILSVAKIGTQKRKEKDYLAERVKKDVKGKITREQLRKYLKIPSPYYLNRGFSAEVLEKFCVGDCWRRGKPLYGRAVVPIFDENSCAIGFSGRSIYDWDIKWLHSGFEKSQNIFNYWEAAPHIKESQTAIIVESPNNVLRFEEAGIHNSLAIFGNNLSDSQQFMLERLGVMNLVVTLDNDEAGQEGKEKIRRLCRNLYNLSFPKFPGNDIAEMSVEQVREIRWI